jgi:hypothetical protein
LSSLVICAGSSNFDSVGLLNVLELLAHHFDGVDHVRRCADVVAKSKLQSDRQIEIGGRRGHAGIPQHLEPLRGGLTVNGQLHRVDPGRNDWSHLGRFETPVRHRPRILAAESRLFPDVRILWRRRAHGHEARRIVA